MTPDLTRSGHRVIGLLGEMSTWDATPELMAATAQGVQAAGAELLVLCTNTMNRVVDEVQAAISIPLLHIADTTAEAVDRAGVRSVGLLGTAFTLEQDFYRDRPAMGSPC